MVVALSCPAYAQLRDGRDNPLSAARDLYASARYDEALAVLNGLQPSTDNGGSDRKSIEQYRSLCLLALGRGIEAESAIAAVVTADPLFMPGEAEASPRVRAAFSDVRQKLLPELAATRYASAKAAYDRKDYPSAEQQFKDLVTLLNDPQMGNRLNDLRTRLRPGLSTSPLRPRRRRQNPRRLSFLRRRPPPLRLSPRRRMCGRETSLA